MPSGGARPYNWLGIGRLTPIGYVAVRDIRDMSLSTQRVL